MSQWQMYWPNWWKLWPSFHRMDDEYNGVKLRHYWFCFGPFQSEWVRFRRA